MQKELTTILFRVEDMMYDWESIVNSDPGYEFVSCKKIENLSDNWPKWSIIVDYKRNKK